MIKLDLQTFFQSGLHGTVVGVIFLKLKTGEFPDSGWSDFPVIILSWWSEAFFQLDVPSRREVKWRFIDGPQIVTLTKVVFATSPNTFKFSEVHGALIDATESVLAHCQQHRMFSEDLELLRQNIQRLKMFQTVQRTNADHPAQIEFGVSTKRSPS